MLPCDADDIHYTLGMKNVSGGVKLKVNEGVPELTVSFKAKAKINGARKKLDPHQIIFDDVVSDSVLKGAEEELKTRFSDLIETCREADCDILGIKEQLYKGEEKYYEAFKDDILTRMQIKYEVEVGSID